MPYAKLFFTLLIWFTISCGNKEDIWANTNQFVRYNPNTVKIEAKSLTVFQITVPFEVRNGFHIQTLNPKDPNVIPTQFRLKHQNGKLNLTDVVFKHKAHILKIGDAIETEVISHGFLVVFTVNGIIEAQKPITFELYYQTCDNKKCYFPKVLPVQIAI